MRFVKPYQVSKVTMDEHLYEMGKHIKHGVGHKIIKVRSDDVEHESLDKI